MSPKKKVTESTEKLLVSWGPCGFHIDCVCDSATCPGAAFRAQYEKKKK